MSQLLLNDRKLAEQDRLLHAGECPNGCGPLEVKLVGFDCTVCGFHATPRPKPTGGGQSGANP